jgi:tRNA G18 (ribose-2'-O)-methylase SpoU
VTANATGIASLEDPRVALFRDVADAELRERAGLFLVEGRLNVRRLLAARRFRTRALLLSPAAQAALADALARLDAATPVYVAAPRLLSGIAGYHLHRGCLAAAERGEPLAAQALLRGAGRRLLLVLEDVANPDNVGGAFRNAWAFGASGVLLSPACADPLGRKATRVSMGGTLEVPFARVACCAELCERLRAEGFAALALTTDPAAPPLEEAAHALRAAPRLALLLGSEGDGLRPATLAAAGACARIRMARGVDSLNLATAAGIALHRLAPLGGGAGGCREADA